MDLSPTLLIVLGIVCIFLGYIASVLINTLREESEPAGTLDDAPPGGKRGRYTPVTRLWREKKAGTLVVEINGKSFVAPSALNEAERAELEQSARDLRAWLGMGLASMPAASAATTVAPTPVVPAATPVAPATPAAPATTVAQPPASPKDSPRPETNAIPLPPPATAAGAAKPAETVPPAASAPAVPAPATPAPVAAAKSKSIAMQIDDILQDLLAGTPLMSRGIKLMEDPRGGVVVYVGVNHYDGIESVPDPEVKAVLKRAVQEWESAQ